MPLTITSATVTGNPGESGWAQAYHFAPDDPEKLKSRGQFFAVIATNTKETGVDAVSAGREVISRLHEEYFGNLSLPAFDALKTSVQKVIEEFSSWEGVEIGCTANISDVTNIAVGGGTKVSILRDEKLLPLVQSEKGKSVAASGYPQEKDVFIIGTRAFFASFSQGIIKGAISGKDPGVAVEALAPRLHSLPQSGSVGALFISFGKGNETQIPIAKIESEKSLPSKFPIGGDQSRFAQRNFESKAQTLKEDIDPNAVVIPEDRNFLKNIVRSIKERRVYVKADANLEKKESPKKKLSLGVGVGLFFVLIISIIFGVREKRERDIKATYEETLALATHNLNEAQELYSLNPERSRELLLEAREKVLGLSTINTSDQTVSDLKKKIEENEKRILGEYRLDTEDFVDLALLSEGFEGDEMVASQENIYILDADSRRIIRVRISNKRSEVVVGPHMVEKIDRFAAYVGRVFIVNSEGVFEVEEGTLNKKIEAEWMGEVLPYSYAGNFYILDKGASTIYRYPGTDEGFGSKRDWFNQGVTYDVSQALSWVIDGALWVVTNEGEVLKFSLGYPQNFALSEISPALSKIDAIYTDDTVESLYLLDSENERVVVTSKEGEYLAQYISPDIRQAKDLAVSEGEKRLILLTNDKLLSIGLEHI